MRKPIRILWIAGLLHFLGAGLPAAGRAAEQPVYFGVLNQRSIALTAEFWNPILNYVSRKSGVPLTLKMGRTAPETTEMTVRGEFGYAYTNHLFTPERDRLGWRVIARPDTPAIRAQVIVAETSDIHTLSELAGKPVVFPSREAFVGYMVPSHALRTRKIAVQEIFATNQEAAITQLRAGTALAAAVNANVLEAYARRVSFGYRVLWTSEGYLDLPIIANPKQPAKQVKAVQRAFAGMGDDPEGREILARSAAVIKHVGAYRFMTATNRDYDSYRQFYRQAKGRAR